MDSNLVLHGGIPDVMATSGLDLGWDVEATPLEMGEPRTDMVVVQSDGLQMCRVQFDKSAHHTGVAPKGCRTFGLLTDPGLSCSVYGSAMSGDDMLVMPSTGDMDILSGSRYDILHVAIPEEELHAFSEDFGRGGLFRKLEVSRAYRPHNKAAAYLRQTLLQVSACVQGGNLSLNLPAVREDIVSALQSCFIPAFWGRDSIATSSRRRIVNQAIEFIRATPNDNISLAALSRAVGSSERTLLYAFKACLNITPKAYIKAYRLNGVHRDLLRYKKSTVTEIATRWGFWHMSQFSVDYRRQFGELPSNTLRKTRKRLRFIVPPGLVKKTKGR